MSQANNGRKVVRAVFGGALYVQGKGFYSALEFFAILRGAKILEEYEAERGVLKTRVLPPPREMTEYFRPSHDHARRLLATGEEVVAGVFRDEATRRAVHSLLRGLEVPVPGRRSEPDKMQLRHFFPYPSEAIHYDAVESRGKLNAERYLFRGAGGLAHKALRTDPNAERLNATREKLRCLLSESDSAVGRLLNSLSDHDEVQALPGADGKPEPFPDIVEWRSLREADSETDIKPTQWVDLIREGVHRILIREGPSNFERVDALVHWIPFCTALHQLAMARRWLGEDECGPLVLDAGREASPVRDRARRHLSDSLGIIKKAMFAAATDMGHEELKRGSNAWWHGSRAFFTGTLHAIGAINAATGKRHLVLRPQLLQAIVHAMVDEPVSFEVFSRSVLGDRLGLVAEPKSAEHLGIDDLSGRSLQNNATQLLARLDEVGLLRSYSDTTMMVGVHA